MTIEKLIAKWHAEGVPEEDILKRTLLVETLRARMYEIIAEEQKGEKKSEHPEE